MNILQKFFPQKDTREVAEEAIKKENKKRTLTGFWRKLSFVVGVSLTLLVFWTAFNGVFLPMIQIGIAMCTLLALAFLWIPGFKHSHMDKPDLIDIFLVIMCLVCLVWTLYSNDRFVTRIPYVSKVLLMDKIVGVALLVMVLEAARRTVGGAICVIAGIIIAYGFLGPYMPAMLMHKGLSFSKFIETTYCTTEGLFGSLTSLCSAQLFAFVAFGSFLSATGADKLFMDLALAVAGKSAGGPAKVSVLSSGAMAMVSGSSVANVVTTGTLTIPMMKKTGFRAEVAGAVEAVASSGGQITPPVMGTVAFLIADNIGTTYFNVVKDSFLPAFMFYFTVWFFVDCMAKKQGMKGLPAEQLPKKGKAFLTALPLIIPILILVYLLYAGYTAFLSGAVCTILIVLVTMLKKETRLDVKRFFLALEATSVSMVSILPVVACASIIVAVLNKTGFMIKSTSIIMFLSGGHLMVLILILLVMSYIIGCGLPSATCYIILATLCAPALVNFGIELMEAHLLIFWFSQVAGLTPPVCITAFVAAGIAGADPMKTGFQSLKMGSSFYFVPMFFLFSPLVSGTWFQRITVLLVGLAAVYMFVAVIEGYLHCARTSVPVRLGCLVSTFFLFWACIDAEVATVEPIRTAIGIGVAAVLMVIQLKKAKMAAVQA